MDLSHKPKSNSSTMNLYIYIEEMGDIETLHMIIAKQEYHD